MRLVGSIRDLLAAVRLGNGRACFRPLKMMPLIRPDHGEIRWYRLPHQYLIYLAFRSMSRLTKRLRDLEGKPNFTASKPSFSFISTWPSTPTTVFVDSPIRRITALKCATPSLGQSLRHSRVRLDHARRPVDNTNTGIQTTATRHPNNTLDTTTIMSRNTQFKSPVHDQVVEKAQAPPRDGTVQGPVSFLNPTRATFDLQSPPLALPNSTEARNKGGAKLEWRARDNRKGRDGLHMQR